MILSDVPEVEFGQELLSLDVDIESINVIVKAVNDGYIINFKETKKQYSIGTNRNFKEDIYKDPVPNIRDFLRKRKIIIPSGSIGTLGKVKVICHAFMLIIQVWIIEACIEN